jgi:excisionase family DNA binding protein
MSIRRHRVIDQPIQDLSSHPSPYVTVSVLAEYLSVERDTVVRMIHLQTLFAFKVGREWRIPIEAAREAFPSRRSMRAS